MQKKINKKVIIPSVILVAIFLAGFIFFSFSQSAFLGTSIVNENWEDDDDFSADIETRYNLYEYEIELDSNTNYVALIPRTTLTNQQIGIVAWNYQNEQYDPIQYYEIGAYAPIDKDYSSIFVENEASLFGTDYMVNGFTGIYGCQDSWESFLTSESPSYASNFPNYEEYDYVYCVHEGETFSGAMETIPFPIRTVIDGDEYFQDGVLKLQIFNSGNSMEWHPEPLYFNLFLIDEDFAEVVEQPEENIQTSTSSAKTSSITGYTVTVQEQPSAWQNFWDWFFGLFK